ncbi:MAG: hypothetical protein ABSD98_19710, partial [Candidatus Korobacteraceae bacterium]
MTEFGGSSTTIETELSASDLQPGQLLSETQRQNSGVSFPVVVNVSPFKRVGGEPWVTANFEIDPVPFVWVPSF